MALSIDNQLCETLAQRGSLGDLEACREMVKHLWPEWEKMVRSSRRMGVLATSEDHVRNVVTRLVPKFSKHGLGLYKQWRSSNQDKAFVDWMRIVVSRVELNYVESQLGPIRRQDEHPSPKKFLNEFTVSEPAAELGNRPPYTDQATAEGLLRFARERLPAGQFQALSLWINDEPFDRIAVALGIEESKARSLQRAAVAVLRRHFGTAHKKE